VTVIETIATILGVGLGIHAVIAGLSQFSKGRPKPAAYDLGQVWTRGPLLWTAVDEVVAAGAHHGNGGPAARDGAPAELIGGRASGRY